MVVVLLRSLIECYVYHCGWAPLRPMIQTLTRIGSAGTFSLIHSFSVADSHNASLKYIVDLTFAYPNGKALNFAGFAIGTAPPSDFALHYRCYPANEIPLDAEGLTKWIYDRYVEKEALLDVYYKTGTFPKLPSAHENNKVLENPRQVMVNERLIFSLNLLFIFSSAVHYALFRYILSFIF
jgi:lysophosphatidylglycerol acyltransferase 1